MGQIAVTWGNEIERKKKKEQKRAIVDNAEIGIVNDENVVDLTDLVMAQSEKIELLEAEIKNLKNGGK